MFSRPPGTLHGLLSRNFKFPHNKELYYLLTTRERAADVGFETVQKYERLKEGTDYQVQRNSAGVFFGIFLRGNHLHRVFLKDPLTNTFKYAAMSIHNPYNTRELTVSEKRCLSTSPFGWT